VVCVRPEGEIPSCAAALPKWRCSATATNAVNFDNSLRCVTRSFAERMARTLALFQRHVPLGRALNRMHRNNKQAYDVWKVRGRKPALSAPHGAGARRMPSPTTAFTTAGEGGQSWSADDPVAIHPALPMRARPAQSSRPFLTTAGNGPSMGHTRAHRHVVVAFSRHTVELRLPDGLSAARHDVGMVSLRGSWCGQSNRRKNRNVMNSLEHDTLPSVTGHDCPGYV